MYQGWNRVSNANLDDPLPDQIWMWASLIKVVVCIETYISDMANWFCVIAKII